MCLDGSHRLKFWEIDKSGPATAKADPVRDSAESLNVSGFLSVHGVAADAFSYGLRGHGEVLAIDFCIHYNAVYRATVA